MLISVNQNVKLCVVYT